MMYAGSVRRPDPEPRLIWTSGAQRPVGGLESGAVSSAVNDSNVAHHRSSHHPPGGLVAR